MIADSATEQRRSALPTTTAIGVAVVISAQLMLVLDSSIVTVALPEIGRSLAFSPTDLPWVITAYTLALGGLILLSGKIGSVVGSRRTLMIGIAVFTVASVAGGFAASPPMLIAARVIQGIGAALAAPSTLALLITHTGEGRQRSRAMAFYVVASGSGGAIGLILGGVLTKHFGWEGVMFVNVPLGLLVIVGAALFVNETDRRPARLDVGGAICSTVGMTALVFAFIRAASHGWADSQTLLAFGVAIAAFVGLVAIDRHHPSPVVQLNLFARMRTASPLLALLLIMAALWGWFYFVTLFAQNVLGLDPLTSGLAVLPYTMALLGTNEAVVRWLIPRVGDKATGVLGLAVFTVGMVWLGQIDASISFAYFIGPVALLGCGAGLTFTPLTSIAMSQGLPHQASTTSSLVQAVQHVGGAIGIAALTTIYAAFGSHSGEARGISSSIVAGAAFAFIALVIFAVWGPGRSSNSETRKRK